MASSFDLGEIKEKCGGWPAGKERDVSPREIRDSLGEERGARYPFRGRRFGSGILGRDG
jgi:hypothetical protein